MDLVDYYQARLNEGFAAIGAATRKLEEESRTMADINQFVSEGDTVYCILRHVSRSGMSRVIDLVVIRDGEPRNIGRMAADVLGMRYDRENEGVKIGGAGMDMGFALVYELSQKLYGDGYKLSQRWL